MFNLSPETQSVLKARFSSFLWRLGGMTAGAALAFTSENIGLLELPTWAVMLVGLGIGEATKFVNSNWPYLQSSNQIGIDV